MREESSHVLTAGNGLLSYNDAEGNSLWQMPLERIVLLAEFTNDEGPKREDHFLVFWSFEEGELHRALAGFHAEGREETIKSLSDYWQIELKLELAASGQWASRVVWPKELEDHQYLGLEEIPAATLRQKIRGALFGPVQHYLPTEEVSEYLRRYNPDF
jgi:hypothetical protein